MCCGARERLVQVEVAHGFLISPDKDGVCVCGGGEREGGGQQKKETRGRERERERWARFVAVLRLEVCVSVSCVCGGKMTMVETIKSNKGGGKKRSYAMV